MTKTVIDRIKAELDYYRALAVHPGTPYASKWLIGLALAYLLNPLDIIPDFIPVIGHLDDIAVVPLLIWAAMKLIPPNVKDECRKGRG